MKELRRLVSIINTFHVKTRGSNNQKIDRTSNADISQAILTNPFVFVLYISILPDIEEDNFENFDGKSSEKLWYNDMEMIGKIRLWILKLIFNSFKFNFKF